MFWTSQECIKIDDASILILTENMYDGFNFKDELIFFTCNGCKAWPSCAIYFVVLQFQCGGMPQEFGLFMFERRGYIIHPVCSEGLNILSFLIRHLSIRSIKVSFPERRYNCP